MTEEGKRPLEPAIHRVRLDKLTIFEITEAELDALEQGSPESIYFNLAIAVISTAVTASIALATTDIQSVWTFCVWVIVTVISYLSGATFGLLWWQSRRSLKGVAHEIRRRKVPEGVQEDVSPHK